MNRAYATNGLNEYSAAGNATFTYDANGNLISDGSRTYTYDVENRMVAATAPASGGGFAVQLGYDPLGRLAWTTGNPNFTQFLYDGDALVAEYDYDGNIIARYVHGPGADRPLIWYDGAPIGHDNLRSLYTDHQGSIVGVSDFAGNRLALNTYDEYGIPGAANQGRFQYTGQAWLPEFGMYYYKARMYSPTLGRFMQTDPIGYADQVNLYEYVGDDPVDRLDPTGLEQCVAPRAALCRSYFEAQRVAERAASSPLLSASQRREILQAIRSARADDNYQIVFAPPSLIDTMENHQGFAFTQEGRSGRIYTVLPDDFDTLFDRNAQLGATRNSQVARAATVAHENAHHDDERAGRVHRGDRAHPNSPTERHARSVEGSVRLPRLVLPGMPYHVTQRGNRREQTFFEDGDYVLYRQLLAEAAAKSGAEIWAYCLMPNHVHVIVVPSDADGLRRTFGEAHRRYTELPCQFT